MNRFVLAIALALFSPFVAIAQEDGDPNVDSINAHFGKDVSPDDNGFVLLMQAFGPRPEGVAVPDDFFAKLGVEKPPEEGDYFVPFDHDGQQREKFNKALEGLWSKAECPAVVEWIEANQKPLELVIKGIRRPHWYSPVVRWKDDQGRPQNLMMTLLPAVQEMRALARLLVIRANLAIHEKRFDEAWADILSCHRLGRMQSRGPTLIDYLVGAAIISIADSAQQSFFQHSQLDAKTLAAMQKQWRQLPVCAHPTTQIKFTEKVMLFDVLDDLKDGQEPMPELFTNFTTDKKTLAQIDWEAVKIRTADSCEQVVELMKIKDFGLRTQKLETWKQQAQLKGQAARKQIRNELAQSDRSSPNLNQALADAIVGYTLTVIPHVDGARCRAITRIQNTDLYFALQMHRAETGQFPKRLVELVPAQLESIPVDPFSGSDLKYKQTEDGFLLYSVGQNGVDENGTTYGETLSDTKGTADDLRVSSGVAWRNQE